MNSDPVSDNQPTDNLAVQVEWVDHVVVLTVSGELDIVTAPQLSEALGLAMRNEPSKLLVDLSKLDFLSSAGMSVLVNAQREAGTRVRVGVVAKGSTTFRPMHLTGVDEDIAVYASRAEALAAE